jgi:hypothetical protein
MRRSDRVLAAAVLASAAAHLLALLGAPRFDLGAAIAELPPPPPIEVRLVPPSPPPAPVVQPRKRTAGTGRASPRVAPPPLLAERPGVPQYEFPEAPPVDAGAGAVAAAPEAGPAAPLPVETAASPSEYPLRQATLVFDLYYGAHESSRVGQVVHTWAQDGREYRVETVAEAVGFVSWLLGGRLVQRASGVLGAGGLAPTAYHAELGTRERAESARFDWSARELVLESRGEARRVDLPAGAQDPLSMLHQLYFMAPIPDAAQLDIVTGRRLYRYVYRTVGEVELETPLGVVRALHLHRRDPDGASMDVWLDLERNLLPARIHVVDRKGRVLRQEIREARLELAAAAR